MAGEKRFDRLALLACLLLALAVRLPGLAAFLTADEARSWFGRSIIFLDSLARADWANTAPGGSVAFIENVSLSPAPGVTTMWAGALGLLLVYLGQGGPGSVAEFLRAVPFDPLDPAILPWLRLPGALAAAAAVGLTYWWGRPLLGRWGSLLAAGLLALDPFSLALSRVLGHDALVATFMWLSLLALVNFIRLQSAVRRWPFLLLSGGLAGLAFLSKYPALFMGAFTGLALLALYLWPLVAGRFAIRDPESPQPAARLSAALAAWAVHLGLWSAAAGLVVVLLWPAMWVQPVQTVTTILSDALRASGDAHQKGSFFLGRPVPDPGLLFYPLVAALRTTPVVLLGLLLWLWAAAIRPRSGARRPGGAPAVNVSSIILWSYIILYTLLVTYGGKKQDRYLLPVFPALVFLASAGYLHLAGVVHPLLRVLPKSGRIGPPRPPKGGEKRKILASEDNSIQLSPPGFSTGSDQSRVSASGDRAIQLSQCHSDRREESLLPGPERSDQRQVAQDNEKFMPVARAFIRRLQGFLLPLRSGRNDMSPSTGLSSPNLTPLLQKEGGRSEVSPRQRRAARGRIGGPATGRSNPGRALFKRPLSGGWGGAIAFVLLLLFQALFVLPSYPYYFSYYNPLAGGGAVAARTIQVGWGEGLNEAAAYLNTLPRAESLKAVSWYSTTFEPYFNGRTIYKIEDEKISRSAKPGLAADVVIFYINQVQRRLPSDGALAYFRRGEPLFTVRLNGQPYVWIYPGPGLAHIIPGEARLVGQAELLGYDLLDEAGSRLEEAPSGGVSRLRLYWEWQGNAPDEPIGVSLVDAAGETWGWGHLLASICPAGDESDCRQEGTIKINDYALAVEPGTPPGTYQLQAWIDRPATGEVVGRFPLAAGDAPVSVGRPVSPPEVEDLELAPTTAASLGPLQLLGYYLPGDPWQPGQAGRLELAWSLPAFTAAPQPETAGRPAPADVMAELSLVPLSPGVPPASAPAWQRPVTPAYPVSRWLPGDLFRDVWRLELPPTTPAGRYVAQLRVNDDTVQLGQVEVAGRPRLFKAPDIDAPLSAALGDSIRLLGYSLDAGPHMLDLTLFWQAVETPAEDVTVFVQLLDGDRLAAQQDSQPQAGAAPTSTWTPGEIVPDAYHLSFAPPAPGQSYRLVVGMYRPASGERLPITTGTGVFDALTLAEVGD